MARARRSRRSKRRVGRKKRTRKLSLRRKSLKRKRVKRYKASFKAAKRSGIRSMLRPSIKRMPSVPESIVPSKAIVYLDYPILNPSGTFPNGALAPYAAYTWRGNDPFDPSASSVSNSSAIGFDYWAANYTFYRCTSSVMTGSIRFTPMFDPGIVVPNAMNDVGVGVVVYAHLEGLEDPIPDKTPTLKAIKTWKNWPGVMVKEARCPLRENPGTTIKFKFKSSMFGITGDRYAYQEAPCSTINHPVSRYVIHVFSFRRTLYDGLTASPSNGSMSTIVDANIRYKTEFLGRAPKAQQLTAYKLAPDEHEPLAPILSHFGNTHTAVYEPDGMDPIGNPVAVYEWYPPAAPAVPVVVSAEDPNA